VNLKKTSIALSLAVGTAMSGCGTESQGPLDGVESIVFIQRPKRNDMGDVFQYSSYQAGARLVTLSPPTADGELTVICCDQDPDFAEVDIATYDIGFDAREIVMSAKLSGDQRYGLFVLTLDDGQIEQLPTDPSRDYLFPVFVPGGKIFFMTNAVVEEGAPQHVDEYERGTTAQSGVINRDGSGETLGARNLSHRVHPSSTSDGRLLMTQWDHLGDMNAGHLMFMNPDMTLSREAFGKEGTGVTNSYLKAREISPGRVVAIGTDRDRTVQSGAILDIRLGEAYTQDGDLRADRNASEKNASYRILTPQVPLGREPSSQTIGRYYDAFPLNAREYPDLLVSWADGPVESSTLGAAQMSADFGVYLYDSERQARKPIWNDTDYWDIFPRPLVERPSPPEISSTGSNMFSDESVLIGSMNVYESSLDDAQFPAGSVYGVRVLEGFSSEEGVPDDFGLTEHEGAANLGVARVRDDGSWAALIPANVPVHLQPIDVYAMSLKNETVWFSGNHGESRFCGGCHEDRAATTIIEPGLTDAVALGPQDLLSEATRAQRVSTAYTRDEVVGVPWDVVLQPIFDAKCVSCHNGTPGAANPSYTITEPETGMTYTWTFDLSGDPVDIEIGDLMMTGYSASHMSLIGPMMADLEEAGLVITGDFKVYIEAGSARDSELITKLNPVQQYPEQNMGNRAFDGEGHVVEMLGAENDLTADEYHLFVLMADAGGQYYSRENAPGGAGYGL
jgi:hypothetical protein